MISIVIPLYNKAHTIIRTIQSVLMQTYHDYEIIIVDDGSEDGGNLIVSGYFSDSRIRIIRQENQGVSVARNVGIEASRGDLISFLDADDEWEPDYLKTVYETATKYKDCGLILTARFGQDFQKGIKKAHVPKRYEGRITEIGFFENPYVYSHISACTVRRELLNPPVSWNRFIAGQKYNEDFFFLFSIALHTKVLYIGKCLSVYNGNVIGQATSHNNEELRKEGSLIFHNRIMEEWNAIGCKNKSFLVFMKYEFRHLMKTRLLSRDYLGIITFLDSKCGQKLTTTYERWLYKKEILNHLSVLYINVTKALWRLHGYPIVGKS